MFDHRPRRAGAALLTGGALGIAVTTALELLTAPYSPAVSAYPMNGAVHLAKVAAVLAFAVGVLGFRAALRDRLGRVGSIAAVTLAVATLLGAVPYSVVEASLDPSLSPAAADQRLNQIYDSQLWIAALAMAALPLIVLAIVTLAVVVLRRRVLPRWAPLASLGAIPLGVLAGVLGEAGVLLPHPPAWVFLGLAAYGLALSSTDGSLTNHRGRAVAA